MHRAECSYPLILLRAKCASHAGWPIPDSPLLSPPFFQVNTSGYDIRNDADDVYLFVVRGDYTALKTAYVALTGPVPLLPDWAFGTWFTEWHNYSQAVAEAEQRRWRTDRLPLSVWGLDVNVRALTSGACHARTECCCRPPLPDDLVPAR